MKPISTIFASMACAILISTINIGRAEAACVVSVWKKVDGIATIPEIHGRQCGFNMSVKLVCPGGELGCDDSWVAMQKIGTSNLTATLVDDLSTTEMYMTTFLGAMNVTFETTYNDGNQETVTANYALDSLN